MEGYQDPFERAEELAEEIPEIPEGLLKYLEKAHPARCLRFGENVDAHREYSGQRLVVEWMRHHYNEQQNPEPYEGEDVFLDS